MDSSPQHFLKIDMHVPFLKNTWRLKVTAEFLEEGISKKILM